MKGIPPPKAQTPMKAQVSGTGGTAAIFAYASKRSLFVVS